MVERDLREGYDSQQMLFAFQINVTLVTKQKM